MSDIAERLRIHSVTLLSPEEDDQEDLDDEEEVTDFPCFVVQGEWDGQPFTRQVALELDGRDAEEEHVDGYDLEEAEEDISEELYNRIYNSNAYRRVAAQYHGLDYDGELGGDNNPELF